MGRTLPEGVSGPDISYVYKLLILIATGTERDTPAIAGVVDPAKVPVTVTVCPPVGTGM